MKKLTLFYIYSLFFLFSTPEFTNFLIIIDEKLNCVRPSQILYYFIWSEIRMQRGKMENWKQTKMKENIIWNKINMKLLTARLCGALKINDNYIIS